MNKPLSFLLLATALLALSLNLAWVSAQDQGAMIEYRTSNPQASQGDEVTIEMVLKNPDAQSVISVRSWMEYNPAHLEGISIDTTDSPFTLVAPGEDGFEAENGRVKLGRSNISGGVKDKEVVVAKVKFRVKTFSGAVTELKPYDYQLTELGHVSVNIIDQGFPVNILTEEPKVLPLTLNSGVPQESEVVLPPQISLPPVSMLLRPLKLRANTDSGYVDLVWEAPLDLNRSGYFIYYGKTSGQYSRRRTLNNVTQSRIENLPNGEVYYFAVTAFNALNQESDYSDEVGVIVGEPFSSTSPFEGLLASTLGRLPTQPANGPLAWWILLSAMGLSGTLLFRRKSTSFSS